MTIKMTGKEFKDFYTDSDIWPNNNKEQSYNQKFGAYHDDDIFSFGGEVVDESWIQENGGCEFLEDPEKIPDDMKIEIIQGMYFKTINNSIIEREELVDVAKRWQEKKAILREASKLKETLPNSNNKKETLRL